MEVAGNILAIGLPGKGKSTFLNTIANGNPDADIFPAGRSPTAFTKDIFSQVAVLEVPGEEPLQVRIFDIPGLMDGKIKVNKWRDMLKAHLTGVLIDLVFIVVSAHDRVDVGNTMIAVALPFFFETFDLDRCCLVMTHCDQVDDVTCEYAAEWRDELEDAAQGKLCGTIMRFAKSKALNAELGFQGKEPHADEIRREVVGVVRENRAGRFWEGGAAAVGKQAVIKAPEQVDGMKMYKKMTEVVEPDAITERVGDAEEWCPKGSCSLQ